MVRLDSSWAWKSRWECYQLTLNDERAELCRQLGRHRQPALQDILLNLQEKLVPVNGKTTFKLACIRACIVANKQLTRN